ncbi:MAG TPA: rhamnulokinase family protein [Gemmataceae bacterium]|nr:rhamnulokinase family protein [Gemmataceae bacterium]
MSATKKLLAFDLGAESGRGVLGFFDGQRLELKVVHRFANGPVRTLDSMHWDVLGLYKEMLVTLGRAKAEHGGIDSLGVDTWGVDFALLGRGNTLLGNPRHYRDPYTENVMGAALARVPRSEVFRQTGLQFMRFNTLFQLLALQQAASPLLDMAETLLMMPDLFHFFFTGIKANEFTDASTTQFYNPASREWAYDLLNAFQLPTRILGTVVAPGTVLGPLRSSVVSETGINPALVIAPASHDTGSAVAAVPARGTSWAYISSGTWSLMGAELAAPLINDAALRYNFTNEGGVGGTIRFLKNIMGLWLVQECRRAWERSGQAYGYEDLVRLAGAAPAFVSLVDPDYASFMLPQSMPAAMADFCRRTGQPVPVEPGAVVRCALESLALRYRWVLDRLEEMLGQRLAVIHIVGGGSQNELLCQLAADACNRSVVAGPVEATAIGNVLVQALGLGLIRSLAEAREVVRRSFEVREYAPQNPEAWQEPYERFQQYLGHGT